MAKYHRLKALVKQRQAECEGSHRALEQAAGQAQYVAQNRLSEPSTLLFAAGSGFVLDRLVLKPARATAEHQDAKGKSKVTATKSAAVLKEIGIAALGILTRKFIQSL